MFAQEKAEIYGLVCPRTNQIRYIGKAKCASKRLKAHLRELRRSKSPVYCWIDSLRKEGLSPAMVVLCVSWDWRSTERTLIQQGREDGLRLLNVADGGDEPHCSTQQRAENGRANAQMVHGDPARKRLWQLKQRLGVALKAGHLNDATRAKMRLAAQKNPAIFGAWIAA